MNKDTSRQSCIPMVNPRQMGERTRETEFLSSNRYPSENEIQASAQFFFRQPSTCATGLQLKLPVRERQTAALITETILFANAIEPGGCVGHRVCNNGLNGLILRAKIGKAEPTLSQTRFAEFDKVIVRWLTREPEGQRAAVPLVIRDQRA